MVFSIAIKLIEDFKLMGKLRRKALASSKTITLMDVLESVSARQWVKHGVFPSNNAHHDIASCIH